MLGRFLCTAVLLFSATALRADVFSFSYSGTWFGNTVNASGTITATAVIPGIYTITSINGTQNGASMSLVGTNTFIYSGGSGVGSFGFLMNGMSGHQDSLTFSGNSYTETGYSGTNIGSNFKMSTVPEAATLSLLCAMGLGVWVFARKLPSKKQSRS